MERLASSYLKRIIAIAFCIIFVSIGFSQPLKEQKYIDINYAFPQKYTIKSIEVTGIDYLDANTIIALTGLQVGDEIEIPGPEITEALRKIWKENIVGDIQILISEKDESGISLIIKLVEKPRLGKVYLEGIRKGEEKDIKEMLSLVRSQKISPAFEKNIKTKIEGYFLERGFFNVKANLFPFKDTGLVNHTSYRVDIDKGAKVKIKEIIITGNEKISDKELKKKLKKTKERKPGRVFKRSKYIREEYEEGEDAILALYNARGMRDASVELDSVYNVAADLVNLKMSVNEGSVYYFRNITWVGNYIHDDKTLNKILNINRGDLYNAQLLDERLNFNPAGPDISSLYLDNGYLFFSVNPVEVRVENDSIDLEMRIYEGSKAKIRDVYVNGNTKTSDHVILRELRTVPGEDFSRSDLIRTQRELAALGYFDPAQIGIIPKPNPADGTVDIEYTVVEKPSDQLQLSGGFGGQIGFVGSLGLVFSNFSLRKIPDFRSWNPLPAGDGQRLSIRAQSNGPSFQSYSFSFTEPWLGGKKPNSFTVSIFKSASSNLNNNLEREGFIKVSGVSFSLGKRLKWPDDFFVGLLSINLNRYNVDNFGSSLCTTCKANNFNLSGTLSRDNRGNNPQFYTTGARISLNVSVTPPYSLFDQTIEDKEAPEKFKFIEYHKWLFDYERYMQLSGARTKGGTITGDEKPKRAFVLQTRAHFGYIGALNNRVGLGPFERFTLGGSGLSGQNFLLGTEIVGLRGYNDQSINPSPDDGGGTIFSKYVMELRYPIITEGVASIYVLGFAEAGNNWAGFSTFDPFKLKRSVGVGLRIFMPAFGLLGIDYGKGLDPIPGRAGANDGQIHFTIGQMVR